MSLVQEFRPELLSRRGEFFAWLVSIGMAAVLIFGSAGWGPLPILYWAFTIFLFFTAGSISLGNWMDRRAVIRIDSEGIAFENGLRLTRLAWHEVCNAAVIPTRLGKRVQVQGARSHFTFKTMGESALAGQLFRTGFADGEKILETLLMKCGLSVKAEQDGMVYYARP